MSTSTSTDHNEPLPEPAAAGAGYETRDASVSALLTFGIGLIVALVVVDLVILGLYHLFVAERPKAVAERAPSNLYQQLRDLHAAEDAALGRYGWADREAGVVRIPIERAIDLVAEKGVRFGKGPRTELEMNSHAGTPAPAPVPSADKGTTSPPGGTTGPKP